MKITASDWQKSQVMNQPNFEIHFYQSKDFQKVQMHSHDFFELYFFLSGEATYIVENGHYLLNPGDILLVSPSNLHQLDVANSKAFYQRIVLWIRPRYVKSLSSPETDLAYCFDYCSDSGNHLIRDEAISSSVKNQLFSLLDVSKKKGYGNDIESQMLIQRLLLELSRYVKGNKKAVQMPEINPLVAKAMAYIDGHLDGDLSLDHLATTLYIGKYYLSHLFKEETQTTPHRYILKKRLWLARGYIEKGWPIREVYLKAGFSDYTHFFRAFKQEFGETPKEHLLLSNQ